jgi:hypothetical protein
VGGEEPLSRMVDNKLIFIRMASRTGTLSPTSFGSHTNPVTGRSSAIIVADAKEPRGGWVWHSPSGLQDDITTPDDSYVHEMPHTTQGQFIGSASGCTFVTYN